MLTRIAYFLLYILLVIGFSACTQHEPPAEIPIRARVSEQEAESVDENKIVQREPLLVPTPEPEPLSEDPTVKNTTLANGKNDTNASHFGLVEYYISFRGKSFHEHAFDGDAKLFTVENQTVVIYVAFIGSQGVLFHVNNQSLPILNRKEDYYVGNIYILVQELLVN